MDRFFCYHAVDTRAAHLRVTDACGVLEI